MTTEQLIARAWATMRTCRECGTEHPEATTTSLGREYGGGYCCSEECVLAVVGGNGPDLVEA